MPTFGSLFAGIGGLVYNPPMPRGARPKQYDPALVEAVRARYESGATQSEIGDALGLSQKVIWNLMRRHDITARVAAKRDQRGEKNSSWRGRDAGYKAMHLRLYRGQPKRCELCGTTEAGKTYDWANMTGHYDDPSDYKRLCRSCHWKHDQKHKNLGRHAERKEVPDA